MYRALSNNETQIVTRVLCQERGLSEDAADSLRLAYKAQAIHYDIAEFDIFSESERERVRVVCDVTSSNIESKTLSRFKQEFKAAADGSNNIGIAELYFGDERKLSPKHKRIRVLFHNSKRYRQQVLSFCAGCKNIINVDDMNEVKVFIKGCAT